ncbi:GTP pyrophosphokinase [Tuanshanicoccus lijuaniae]|uniref:GTP pyrophosphokinase n=1 Tax=Aerococcaceae bacterium zg-1292 TaxID=2774330 RepID=UPI001BD82955|nr:GTP pyrophosphokinase family protein [Aerococcaceae bacterium zg-BR22]MBS4455339.1 GTP pyrophosphokinase family protein [Aerococcaceae bacterium zg-A91]MBS4457299.1 GTP pyrophosphokinase family protein [Aerococcaceae bacterium zg-BR33]
MDIYGEYGVYLPCILDAFSTRIKIENEKAKASTGFKLYEHLIARVKTHESMMGKCQRKNLPQTTHSALKLIRDSIGVRIVCGFIDDIYTIVELIRGFDGYQIVEEKDYIKHVKPNGYRSYHLILAVETAFPDCENETQGMYFIEVQLRTIAQDSWASLEHQMKYKHEINNAKRIERELKRCADELASCDLSMQTIRQLIVESRDD